MNWRPWLVTSAATFGFLLVLALLSTEEVMAFQAPLPAHRPVVVAPPTPFETATKLLCGQVPPPYCALSSVLIVEEFGVRGVIQPSELASITPQPWYAAAAVADVADRSATPSDGIAALLRQHRPAVDDDLVRYFAMASVLAELANTETGVCR
jgi:hypothetical protein